MLFLVFPKQFEYYKFYLYLFEELRMEASVALNEEHYLTKKLRGYELVDYEIQAFLEYCQRGDNLDARICAKMSNLHESLKSEYHKTRALIRVYHFAKDDVTFEVVVFRYDHDIHALCMKCLGESDIGFLIEFNNLLRKMKTLGFRDFQYSVVGTCGYYGTAPEVVNAFASEHGHCDFVTRAIKYDRGVLSKDVLSKDMVFKVRTDKVMPVSLGIRGGTIFSGNLLCTGDRQQVSEFFDHIAEALHITKSEECIVDMETFDFFKICLDHAVPCQGAFRITSDLCDGDNDKISRLTCSFRSCVKLVVKHLADDISTCEFRLSDLDPKNIELNISYIINRCPSSLSMYLKALPLEDQSIIWDTKFKFVRGMSIFEKASDIMQQKVKEEVRAILKEEFKGYAFIYDDADAESLSAQEIACSSRTTSEDGVTVTCTVRIGLKHITKSRLKKLITGT
mmetsp:Transcript_8425/g.26231  ORF Transcript_8425/g.26231 Transcript_8425/m.26231 type:complete len:452 (+) Transcript_8425:291-1646(+)